MRDVREAVLVPLVAAALTTASAQRLPLLKQEPRLAIVAANVINVRDGSVLANATIVVRNGRIESVGRNQPPSNVPLINLSGQDVVPGLIDAHAHVADIEAATRALDSGVTTIRSLNVSAYADVALRNLAKQSAVAVPDFLAAGYGFRPTLPHDAFLATPEYWDLESGLRGLDMIRRAVRMNAGHRVDWIKIFATEGLANDPHRMLFTEAEVRAAVQEAARYGIPVAAHAFGDQGAASAVSAGVRSIEHGSYVSESTLRLMKKKQVFLVPTIRVLAAIPDSAPASVRARVSEALPRARQSIQMAHKLGVKVAAGTDSRYAAVVDRLVSHEIRELVNLGFSPLQALQSATIVSAEMFRLEALIGSIEPRYEADLMAVAGNPLDDVSVLGRPTFIMTNGRVFLDKTTRTVSPQN